MKLVFCTQNIAPFRMRWMDELGKYFQIIVFHLNEYEKNTNKKYISYNPKNVQVVCHPRYVFGRTLYDTDEIIKAQGDIYLLDGYGFAGQVDLINFLSRRRIPFLISVDGGILDSSESRIKFLFKKWIMSKASAFLSTSEDTDRFIQHYVGEDKNIYRHLFSGLNISDVQKSAANIAEKKALRNELKIDDKFTVISVGKFIHRKGFDILIKALKYTDNNTQVLFVGASDHEIYDNLIDDSNRNKIKFIGFCDKELLEKYYRASDLMLLPTRHDVWGLVIPEAMAQGVPVVTTEWCMAGKAMLDKNDIIERENIQQTAQKINEYDHMPEEEREAKGNENIKRVLPYCIENAVKDDVKNLIDFRNDNIK